MPAHECSLPSAAWQGEETTCRECGSRWWADEVGYDADREQSLFEWRRYAALGPHPQDDA